MDTHGFKHLEPGRRYRIVRAFTDFDSQTHPVDQVWVFRGSSFLPYDDGLSLFISVEEPGGALHDRQIRLRWMDEDQGPIIDHLGDYLVAV